MDKIVLLKDRTNGQEMALTIAVPLIYGAVSGIFLGISEPLYVVLTLSGIAGGFLAGLEHEYPLEGFYRGVLGGTLFGVGILLANGLADKAPKADLPDPEILLVVITGVFGAGLGAWGARVREKSLARSAAIARGGRTVRSGQATALAADEADPHSSSTASASR